MNKTLAKVLCILLVFSCTCPIVMATDSVELTVYDGLLKNLGIVDAEKYNENDTVNRGEAAKYLIQMTGKKMPAVESISIADVNKETSNHKEIETVVHLGWIDLDKNERFKSYDDISVEAFVKGVLYLAGYKDYVAAKYGNDYMRAARGLDLVNTAGNQPLTQKMAYNIMESALDMPFCSVSGIHSSGEVIYNSHDDYTVLNHYFEIRKQVGLITSVNEIHLRGYCAAGTGFMTIKNSNYDETLEMKWNCSELLLGCEVYYYVSDDNEIFYAEKRYDEGKTLSLEYKDIDNVSVDRRKISYFGKRRIETAKVAIDATFIYNGVNYDEILPTEMHSRYTSLVLIDPDDDNEYDIVIAKHSEWIVVYTYDSYNKTIADNNGKKFNLSEEEYDRGIRFYTGDGKQIAFKDIKRGSLIEVAMSRDKSHADVWMHSTAISGIVNSMNANEDKFCLDGTTYETLFDLSTSGIEPGDYIQLWNDARGRTCIIRNYGIQSGEYAYLVDICQIDAAFNTKIKAKLMMQDGNVEISEFAEKFYVNDEKGNYTLLTSKLTEGGNPIHQLVKVMLVEGKIKRIYISNTEAGFLSQNDDKAFTLNKSYQSGSVYNHNGYINGECIAPYDAPCFYIPLRDDGRLYEDEIQASSLHEIEFMSAKPEMKVYDVNSYRRIGALVVYGVAGNMGSTLASGAYTDKHPMIVENIITESAEDGSVRNGIVGIQGSMPAKYYGREGVTFDDLSPGDIINLDYYRGDEIHSYSIVFSLNRKKRTPDDTLTADSSYVQPAVYPASYTSKMTATATYGKIVESAIVAESITASYTNNNRSTYSVVLKPFGSSSDNDAFTYQFRMQRNYEADGGYLYYYDTRKHTAMFLSFNDYELSGKTAFCYSNFGEAKLIVIYE